MTPAERFAIWCEGFTDAIEGGPTEKQHQKLREKIRQANSEYERPKFTPTVDHLTIIKRIKS